MSPAQQPPVDSHASGPSGGDDDIYEFREPEPFEFEVRNRRESPMSEERVHHRFAPRKAVKDEEDESSIKKVTNASTVIIILSFCNSDRWYNNYNMFFLYLQRAGSAERNKPTISSPSRGARPCLTATVLSVTPAEEPETTHSAQSIGSPPPAPASSQSNVEIITTTAPLNAQTPSTRFDKILLFRVRLKF